MSEEKVADQAPPSSAAMATKQIRGSSLLLVGRVVSMAINFVVQVLIARYLSQSEYGAFAYALSLVTLGETITTFGLDRGASRFLAMYDERQDYARLLGTLLMIAGTILSFGTALVLLVVGLQSWLAGGPIGDEQAVRLLVILILLSPVQAADNLLSGVLAVFASARAIFVRKYLLAPCLRLVVVLLLVLGNYDVSFLAAGYVISGAAGVVLYLVILWQVLGNRGLRPHLRLRSAKIPFREILGFTLPLLSTDLVYISMTTTDAILLQHFSGTGAVGAFRVIQPLANLNLLVFSSFTILYTPIASRLFARGDRAGIADLYWRTAIWMAVFSFPLFALTSTMARPVTVALYQVRYEDSAVFLALLSLGYYVNAAFGFNGLTLRVFGLVRYTVVINVIAVVANLALNLLLIPHLHALGAAISTTATMVLHNVLKQLGLRKGTGIDVFDWRYARVYLIIAATGLSLILLEVVLAPDLVASVVLAAAGSVLVLVTNRRMLKIDDTFPELSRVPLLRWMVRG